jgi:nitroreductase
MNIHELLDFLRTRRTIRRFKPDPIPDEYIEKMIEAARWSPSGANAQPWEFIIIKNQDTKDKMAELYRQIRYEYYVIEQTHVEELRHHQLRHHPRDLPMPGLRDAPVIFIVCGDRRTFQATVLAGRFIGEECGLEGTYTKNIANATYGLMLAAAALGLGAQWLTIGADWAQMLKPLLGVPAILQLHTMVPVGYPAYEPRPPYRRDIKEIVHYDKYDMSKFRPGDQIIEFIRRLRELTDSAYAQERRRDRP